jgi:hypothetical protein
MFAAHYDQAEHDVLVTENAWCLVRDGEEVMSSQVLDELLLSQNPRLFEPVDDL